MSIGSKIKALREQKHMTQEDVAKQVGVAIQTIFKYENDIVTIIPLDKLEKISKALGTTPAYLMGWDVPSKNELPEYDNIFPVRLKKFRLLGDIACGKPILANEEYDYIKAGADIQADFCLRAEGDSMIGARIHNGDIVFVREQPMVENGEIAAVIIDDKATLKRWYYYPDKNKLVLAAENPKYDPLVYINDELNEVRCLGKAICFMSNL